MVSAMAETAFGLWKFVLDISTSSHFRRQIGLIIWRCLFNLPYSSDINKCTH